MAVPTSPPVTPTPAGPGPSGPATPDESVRVLLSLARSLALVFAILAGLLFLLLLALTVLDAVLGRGAGDLIAAVYCLASAAVLFVVWREMPRLEQMAAARQYRELRDHLIVWSILGILFFVVVGALLLAAWLKAELLSSPRSS